MGSGRGFSRRTQSVSATTGSRSVVKYEGRMVRLQTQPLAVLSRVGNGWGKRGVVFAAAVINGTDEISYGVSWDDGGVTRGIPASELFAVEADDDRDTIDLLGRLVVIDVEKLGRVTSEQLREEGEAESVRAQVVVVEPKWGAFLGDGGARLGRKDIGVTLRLFRNDGEVVPSCQIGDLRTPEMPTVEAESVTF